MMLSELIIKLGDILSKGDKVVYSPDVDGDYSNDIMISVRQNAVDIYGYIEQKDEEDEDNG